VLRCEVVFRTLFRITVENSPLHKESGLRPETAFEGKVTDYSGKSAWQLNRGLEHKPILGGHKPKIGCEIHPPAAMSAHARVHWAARAMLAAAHSENVRLCNASDYFGDRLFWVTSLHNRRSTERRAHTHR
jgi:hypothetical protein